MGITSSDVRLLESALRLKDINYVIELGSQNLYLEGCDYQKPPFANEWYESRGIQYMCIDMAGDNNAIKINLSQCWYREDYMIFDLVTDFGTSEHVADVEKFQSTEFHDGHIHSVYPAYEPLENEIAWGYYSVWCNKHNLVKPGGLIVSVNPKTGNWPGHGYTYIDSEFYKSLASKCDYTIHHLRENAAMGNTKDGWNIECILEKKSDNAFISFDEFQECQQYRK